MTETIVILLRELERKNDIIAIRRERALTKAWLKRYKSMVRRKDEEIKVLADLLFEIISDGYLSLKSKESIDKILSAGNS